MKSKDIVKQYGIDKAAFEAWLPSSGYSFKTSALGGVDVDESQDIGAFGTAAIKALTTTQIH